VTARDGVVTLTGHVSSYAEKHAAEQAAGRVSGVKAIADELEIRYLYAVGHGDEDIAKQALNVLSWDLAVPKDKVKIKIEKGWITLSGDVDWYYQKNAAESDVRKLLGVMGVSNQIVIKPSVQASDVQKKSRLHSNGMPTLKLQKLLWQPMAARSRSAVRWTATTSEPSLRIWPGLHPASPRSTTELPSTELAQVRPRSGLSASWYSSRTDHAWAIRKSYRSELSNIHGPASD
jgi:hypothetical protein